MKSKLSASLIMLIILMFASLLLSQLLPQSAFAFASSACSQGAPVVMACKRGEFLTNVGCSRPSNMRCTSGFTETEKKTYVIGKFKDYLSGELDPFVLGDGSLGLIESYWDASKNYLVYMPSEDSSYLAGHKYYSNQSVIIGIPRSALARPSTEERAQMLDLATQQMGLESTASTYKFTSEP